MAQELGDRAVEAQACYSLGNTYTLLRDYPTAIHYHLKHLAIAQELSDRVGEGRACWSLGNAYSAINNHEKALHYANRHLIISKEVRFHLFNLSIKIIFIIKVIVEIFKIIKRITDKSSNRN